MAVTPLQKMKQLVAQSRADGKLQFSEADALANAALKGNLKRGSLETIKDLFDHPPKDVETDKQGVDAAAGGSAMVQDLYWGMPRHLVGNKGSGQSFKEGISMNSHEYFFKDRPQNPLSFTVSGAAKKSYMLNFKIAEHPMQVKIPKGASAAQTAKLIAHTINASSAEIAKSAAYDNTQAMHWPDSDSYLTGIHATAKGGTVLIQPQIDS